MHVEIAKENSKNSEIEKIAGECSKKKLANRKHCSVHCPIGMARQFLIGMQ